MKQAESEDIIRQALAMMPHLEQMQQELRDRDIGINWESLILDAFDVVADALDRGMGRNCRKVYGLINIMC